MNINWFIVPTLVSALLLFVVGARSVRWCKTPKAKRCLAGLWFLAGIPGFLFPLYYLHGFDDAQWFYVFRSFPWVELTAAGAGLFAGALAELLREVELFPKSFFTLLLGVGIAIPYLKPVLDPLPPHSFSNRWKDDICLQSTPSSCGPASAATVFRFLGYDMREEEMAGACLTCRGGTENWYIARAFRKRGCAVNYRIEQGFPADLELPAIAGVRIGNYGHFIAILAKESGRYITGDPLKGRQQIAEDDMGQAFDFTGFFMEINSVANSQ